MSVVNILTYMIGKGIFNLRVKPPQIKPLQIDFNEIKYLFESLKETLEENKIIMEQDCKISQVINTDNMNIRSSIDSLQIQSQRIKTEYDNKYNKLLDKYYKEKHNYEEEKS